MTPKQSSLCYLTFHQPMQKSLNAVIMKGAYSIKIYTSSISLYLTEKGKSYLSILIKKIIGKFKQIILFFEGGGVIPLEAAFPPAHPPATHKTASSFSPPIMLSTPFKTSSSWLSHDSLGLTTTFASACSFGIRSMDPTHYSKTKYNPRIIWHTYQYT